MATYNTGTTFTLGGVAHTTAFTGTVPSGVATGDVMLVSIEVFTFSGGTPSFTTPTSGGGNWTQIGTNLHSVQGSFDCYSLVYWRVATASDPSSTFTISYNGTPGGTDDFFWAGDLESYTGFYTASPIGSFTTVANVNSTTLTAPSTTTSRAGSWAVYTANVAVNGSGTITGEPPTSRHVTGVSGIDTGVSDSNGSAGGAGAGIGGGTWTFSNSTGGGGGGYTIELCTVAPTAAVTSAPTPPRIPHPLWFRLLEVAETRADWQNQGVASLSAQTWRLMDGHAGRPGVGSSGAQPPSAATARTGNQVNGTTFYVTQSGLFFQGYWWWVTSSGGQPTSAQKFALWSCSASAPSAVVPGSVVTSGTLTAGWNWIPLPAPVPLALFGAYQAATGVNGPYPMTGAQLAPGDPYSNGWANGPLNAPSDAGAGNPVPSFGNGAAATSGSDPSLVLPSADLGAGNIYWLDVQVATTAAYTGSYRLWPNMYDADSQTTPDAAVNYVLANEFTLSQACKVNAIWYYVAGGQGATGNQWATSADIWNVRTQAKVATQASPTWINQGTGTTDTSSNTGRWVYTKMASQVILQPGDYKVSVYNGNATPNGWSAKRLSYWQAYNQVPDGTYQHTPPGANGITWGPLSAPTTPAASAATDFSIPSQTEPGQSTFQSGPPNQYPNLYVGTPVNLFQNYWIDVEVSPLPQAVQTVTVTITATARKPKGAGTTPTFTASRTATAHPARSRTTSRTVTASITATADVIRHRSAARAVTATITAAGGHSGATHATGTTPTFTTGRTATGTAVRHRTSTRSATANITAAGAVTRHRSESRPVNVTITATAVIPGGGRGATPTFTAGITAVTAHSTSRGTTAAATAVITARAAKTSPSVVLGPVVTPWTTSSPTVEPQAD